MANLIYLTANGKKQGLISAGCSTFDSVGNKYQKNHEDQIIILAFEHELTRQQNVNHGPVSFVKPIDKSSPLFGIAISENECMEMKFDFYKNSANGGNEIYYSIKLIDAYLSRMNTIYPHAIDHTNNQPEEMITVKYKSITWTHHKAGTSGYSIWDERVF